MLIKKIRTGLLQTFNFWSIYVSYQHPTERKNLQFSVVNACTVLLFNKCGNPADL